MSNRTEQNRRVIGIFAHNEENRIIACLESIKMELKLGDTCFVLNNGSRDGTALLVEKFSQLNDFCRLVNIDVGDKANAWNVFVHEMGVEADIFYFVDGDCEVVDGAIDALEECIFKNPTANAAAALPSSKVSPKFREMMIKQGGLAGNLYALPRNFVERIKINNIRLPLGLIGDDSLLGALACWDLDPTSTWDKTKIVTCQSASFSYVPFSLFSFKDISLYLRRKIRYSLRRFQTNLMKKPLKERGLSAIPKDIVDVYKNYHSQIKIEWRGIDTMFDLLAARMIKKVVYQTSHSLPE